MGVVYRAYDRDRQIHVALKVLPTIQPDALVRFKREFRTLTSIIHPNLVELYELVSDGEQWFFSMEVVEGTDFLSWVRNGDVNISRVREAIRQLTLGVSAIHAAGRLHRDLKPSNVMVRADSTVVILDFGLVSDVGVRPTEELAGTAAYMAPEQWGSEPLTAACDWYGMGVMLYEALTGQQPFQGRPAEVLRAKLGTEALDPSQLGTSAPAELGQLCCDLLRRTPAMRPSAPQILERLGGPAAPFELSLDAATEPEHRFLVGRERHRESLVAAFASVESGATVTAHVQGPSGTGKSALVAAFLDDLSALSDTAVLSGRCYEQESVPYKALDSLIDALADFLAGLSPDDVASMIPVQAAVLARVFPVLQRVPAIAAAPGGGLRISDPRELRRAAVSALREMLTRIGQRRHLVLAIDDLQWGDHDSALVIGELLAPPDPPRLLLLLSYRSEYADRSPCLTALLHGEVVVEPWQRRVDVTVAPLTQGEGEALARHLLANTDGIEAEDAERIARESGGNPYFIYELARHVGPRRNSAREHAAAPVELDAVLWSRVQRLPAAARELLAIVAVAGQPIELRHVLAAASGEQDHQHALALLRAEHFVRGTGPHLTDVVEAYHDRVRESVMNRLPPDVVQSHHAGLARALESAAAADAETIAEHFEGAGDVAKAAHYFALGASRSASALAFDHAAHLYRRALQWRDNEPSATAALNRELGHALANAGRGFEAAQAYEAAVISSPSVERFELERLAAQQYCISGHVREGRAIFRRLLADVGMNMPSSPAAVLATLVSRRIRLRLRGVRFTERAATAVPADTLRRIDLTWSIAAGLSVPDALGVASLQTKGLLLALDAGEPHRLLRALAFEAFLTGASGLPAAPRAAALMEVAATLAGRLDDPHGSGVVLVMKGLLALTQARFRAAVELALAAEEVLRNRCSGVAWEISLARTVVTWAFWHLGESGELRRRCAMYLADARARGDMFLVTNLRSVVTPFLDLLDDDPEGAARELGEAMAGWPREGFDLQHANGIFSDTNILIYRGRGGAALEAVTSRWSDLRRSLQLSTQLVRVNFTDLRGRAALAAAEGASDRRRLVARAEQDARRLARERTALSTPYSHCLLAGVAALRGQRDLAAEELRQAMQSADAVGDGFRSMATRYRLGQLLDGDAGAEFRAAAAEAITRERIGNPERMAALYVPGFS